MQSTNFAVGVSPAFTDDVRSLSGVGDVSTLKIGSAAIYPSWRASRLNALVAIAYE